MDAPLVAVVALVAFALLFDYTNGFHDSANAVSTIVATRVLRPLHAVAWAAFFNFVAFLFFGTKVADTIGTTVQADAVGLAVIFAALAGAVLWNYLTWWRGLPSSSSHALVGGLVGAGLAAGGWAAIKASSVTKVLVFIVVSPLVGLLIGALLMTLLRLLPVTRRNENARGYRYLQLASSAAFSIGHGANDAQKTMGVIAALLVATGHLAGGDDLAIPLWVVLSAYAAIALGTLSGGWRIVRTMGLRITELHPASGFAAEGGAAVALYGSTLVGAPVSTTHTVAGAITGVGLARREASVRWATFGQMAVAWVVTMPAAGLLAAGMYGITQLGNEIVVGTVLALLGLGFGTLLVMALRRTIRGDDVLAGPEQPTEPAEPLPV